VHKNRIQDLGVSCQLKKRGWGLEKGTSLAPGAQSPAPVLLTPEYGFLVKERQAL
jgi:hypothetical protein